MADGSLNLFQIGARGVNVVTTDVHLLPDETRKSQNAEYSTDEGEGGIEQRPGMSKVNVAALGAAIVAIQDTPAQSMYDYTPYLYAGLNTSATHRWRRSLDGSLWENDDVLSRVFAANANITFYAKGYPKCVTIGRYMYFCDAASPIGLHRWDGTTDTTVATIPPSVTGSSLTPPSAPSVTVASDDAAPATTYTYKLVSKQGANSSAASAAGTTTVGPATLASTDFNAFVAGSLGAPAAGVTGMDVYRTVGGATQGKIGTISVSGGVFTTGNGSGLTGQTFTTPAAPTAAIVIGGNGYTPAGVTYTYKLVKVVGTGHSVVSTGVGPTQAGTPIGATGPTTWGDGLSTHPPSVVITNPTAIAAGEAYDVYRTAGGPSTGKIGTIAYPATTLNDSGQAGDATIPPVTILGLDISAAHIFTDAGLVGDASVAPVVATGTTVGPALGIVDMITDGSLLYVAAIDQDNADPVVYGRILSFNPITQTWTQVGATFPTGSGNGAAGSLALYDGALSYGTFAGITAGNTSYLTGTSQPLPAGGIPEVHTTAVSQVTTALAVFNGVLYAAYASFAAVAAIIAKRVAGGTWSTSQTGPAAAANNAYTSLCVFNGRLFAGWTSGGGATAARIESTLDGITWTLEATLATTDVVCQMVVFNGSLFAVLGKTSIGYNTTSSIMKRTAAGVWSTVDDPSDNFAGCLGVVYT